MGMSKCEVVPPRMHVKNTPIKQSAKAIAAITELSIPTDQWMISTFVGSNCGDMRDKYSFARSKNGVKVVVSFSTHGPNSVR